MVLLEDTVLRSNPIPLLAHKILGLLIEVEASLKVESIDDLHEISPPDKHELCKSA